jgi:membrane protein
MHIPLISGLTTSNIWKRTQTIGKIILQARQEFTNDGGMKMSAALSFYTLFSMAPMLLLVISIGSIFIGKDVAESYLFQQFEGMMGTIGAKQLQDIMHKINISDDFTWVSLVGTFTFFLGATGVFIEIQDSINTIWCIKVKPQRNLIRFIVTRITSFSLVVGIGFLLMASLVINAVLSILNDWIIANLVSVSWLAFLLSNIITFVTVLFLFAVIFKILPDAILKWSDAFVGAIFTALLFVFGKYFINLYLSRSATVSVYGASGAIVLIILWVYYSAIILYFGAEFTKVYANKYGKSIKPSSIANFIQKNEIVVGKLVG